MRLAFHIFSKDVRRLRVEILASLIALAVLSWVEWRTATPHEDYSGRELGRLLPVVVMFSWWLLAVRLVHGEVLVGERPFWRTRPYAWHQLIGGKIMFLLAWVGAPLVLSWTVLLLVGRIPVLATLGHLTSSSAGAVLLSILPCVLIAALTRTMSQWIWCAILLPVLLLVMVGFLEWSFVSQPSCPAAMEIAHLLEAAVFAAFVASGVLLQYSRREWWPGALALLLAIAAGLLVGFGISNRFIVEKAFPIVKDSEVPFRLTFEPAKRAAGAPDDSTNAGDRVSLGFPISVQTADNALLRLEAAMLSIDLPDGHEWKSEVSRGEMSLLAAGEQEVSANVDRSMYERVRAVAVHAKLALAFSEFREKRRETVRVRRTFEVRDVGTCGIDESTKSPTLLCVTGSGLQMGVTTTMCGGTERRQLDFYDQVGVLSPLSPRYATRICRDGNVTFSSLSVKRRFRVKIDLGKVRLQDYPPTDTGISFHLR